MKRVTFSPIFFCCLTGVGLLFASCFSYRQVSYYDENGEDGTVSQAYTSSDDWRNQSYQSYFSEKAQQYQQAPSSDPVFTDVDSYTSVSVENGVGVESVYNGGYGGWGGNTTNVAVNVFPATGGWSMYGSPNMWGWNTFYGPAWGWNTFYGPAWGWNTGWGNRWYNPYWGATNWGYDPFWGAGWGWNTVAWNGFYCPPAIGWTDSPYVVYEPVYHNTRRNYTPAPVHQVVNNRSYSHRNYLSQRYGSSVNYNTKRNPGAYNPEEAGKYARPSSSRSSSQTNTNSAEKQTVKHPDNTYSRQNRNNSSYQSNRNTSSSSTNRSSNESGSGNRATTSSTRSGGGRRGD